MVEVDEEVIDTFVPEKEYKESSMNIETGSESVRAMDESMKAAAVTDKQNE